MWVHLIYIYNIMHYILYVWKIAPWKQDNSFIYPTDSLLEFLCCCPRMIRKSHAENRFKLRPIGSAICQEKMAMENQGDND